MGVSGLQKRLLGSAALTRKGAATAGDTEFIEEHGALRRIARAATGDHIGEDMGSSTDNGRQMIEGHQVARDLRAAEETAAMHLLIGDFMQRRTMGKDRHGLPPAGALVVGFHGAIGLRRTCIPHKSIRPYATLVDGKDSLWSTIPSISIIRTRPYISWSWN